MRLKTKLVLAITILVFLISGLLSLVYVTNFCMSAVQQSYDTNRMVADQIHFALQQCSGERAQRPARSIPTIRPSCAISKPRRCANNDALQAVVESVNRYSLTVYDINIGDSQSSTLLSTNPDNEDKPLPVAAQLRPTARRQSHSVDARRSSARPRSSMSWCRSIAMASHLSRCTSGCAPRCCARSMRRG